MVTTHNSQFSIKLHKQCGLSELVHQDHIYSLNCDWDDLEALSGIF